MLEIIPAARRLTPLRRALNATRVAGIPQYCIAEEAGVSVGQLSELASGQKQATREAGEAISRALGRDVRELFPELSP